MQGYRVMVRRSFEVLLLWGALVLASLLGGEGGSIAHASVSLPPSCITSKAEETDGYRRLALIVGVGKYKNPKRDELRGPAQDVEQMTTLLTGAQGYGFPKKNVCILREEQATLVNFKTAFQQALVDRAKSHDVIVIYFAGHGSQIPDLNNDEADGYDETLLFYDSETSGVGALVDDEFNSMLEQLHQRTPRITVILDTCHSGSAVRGTSLRPRYQKPMTPPTAGMPLAAGPVKSDGSPSFTPHDLPGLVLLSAAADGTSAMDTLKGGAFTIALVAVLKEAPKPPLTYAQADARVRSRLAAMGTSQIPYFQGEVSRTVFENEKRTHAMGLRVTAGVGKVVTLTGPPIPGIGRNAELRVFAGQALGPETQDPKKSKATLRVTASSGLRTTAEIMISSPNQDPIRNGDLAVLVRPSDDFVRLTVRLRPPTEPGGIPAGRAATIRTLIEDDSEKKAMIQLVDDPTADAKFELSRMDNDHLVLRDEENRIRNDFPPDAIEAISITTRLWQHARQRALLQLHGEGGEHFQDQRTLKVSLVPAAHQTPCARAGLWLQAAPNAPQDVPLCYRYNVKVELDAAAPVPLLVGGAILSNNGDFLGFANMLKEPLAKGKSITFEAVIQGEPPGEATDHVLVFGTQKNNPIDWETLTSVYGRRDEKGRARTRTSSTLGRALERYLIPGRRSASRVPKVEDSAWTLSSLPVVVRANSGFLPEAADGKTTRVSDKREYTIPNFDLRSYLPADETTALFRVLGKADSLAKYSRVTQDGVGYQQHAWAERTDADNLKQGIDCSRAIWFAFTRAGLPYNDHGDRYVPTAEMARPEGPMADQFERCDAEPIQLGDVLVYRDDRKGDGHTVMVIDPRERIAWGSHGWDGNVKEEKPPDTGVEYQKIKYKKDWARWDRTTMEKKACWRYRQFVADAHTARGMPGTHALQERCETQLCENRELPDDAFMTAIQETRP